jgi:putative ABC transport system permease protein
MSVFESVRIAWRALFSNKLRTFLAVLGIVFGVASVIAIMSFGVTFKGTITGEVSKFGAGVLFVNSGDGSVSAGLPMNLMTLEDEKALVDALPIDKSGAFVQTSSPVALPNGQPKFVLTIGANENFEDLRNWHVNTGRFFTKAEIDAKAPLAVIGESLRDALFGKDANPIGKKILFKGEEVEIIGMLQRNTLSVGADVNNLVVYPISFLAKLTGETKASGLIVRFKTPKEASVNKAKVEEILLQRHGIKDFTVQNQEELLSTFNKILDNVTLFIGAVAAIALLVGGIGIMNIMLVSVKERTREIGIRKAIGARRKDILIQFLVEATTLTVIGGVIGILTGMGMAYAGARALGWTFVPSLPAMVLGFGFSTVVGIFFGFYPAVQAARLPAVEALRYE